MIEATMIYTITEDCIMCGACQPNCSNMAISEGEMTYVIDATLCDGCGTCTEDCPVEAIRPITA